MTVKFFFAWYDLWVGIYIDTVMDRAYICPLPCCVIQIDWGRDFKT